MTLNRLFSIFILISALPGLLISQNKEARQLYEQGVAENEKGYLVKASVHLTDAIALYPNYADAYYQRALSFQGLERMEASLRDLEKAIELKVDSLNAHLWLMNIYKEKRAYKEALSVTDAMLERFPEQGAGIYYSRGEIFEATNKNKQALEAYRLSLKSADESMTDFIQMLEDTIERLEEAR